jgi:hypothetical protein
VNFVLRSPFSNQSIRGNFTLYPNTYTFTPTNLWKIQFCPFYYLITLISHPHFQHFPFRINSPQHDILYVFLHTHSEIFPEPPIICFRIFSGKVIIIFLICISGYFAYPFRNFLPETLYQVPVHIFFKVLLFSYFFLKKSCQFTTSLVTCNTKN